MIKYLLLCSPLFYFINFGFSQTTTISGVVLNEQNEQIPFATIVEKGKNNGVVTDLKGNYNIKLIDTTNAILVFSFSGYNKMEVPVNGRKSIDVTMSMIIKDVKEVVVIGYGSAKSKELTGASTRVGGENIEKLNISRVDQALQGQVSGVNVSTNSGSPGGSANIRIRGISTFGDNDPLILVDGIVYDSEGLNALNPSDIKSVNVLKDATAGIYGVRAANGVIIVETKNGSMNSKPKFEYNAYYGIQQTARKLDLLTAQEYAVIKN